MFPFTAYESENSDTATPRFPVPIIFLHTIDKPFCDTPTCECNKYKKLVQQIFAQVAQGELTITMIDLSKE